MYIFEKEQTDHTTPTMAQLNHLQPGESPSATSARNSMLTSICVQNCTALLDTEEPTPTQHWLHDRTALGHRWVVCSKFQLLEPPNASHSMKSVKRENSNQWLSRTTIRRPEQRWRYTHHTYLRTVLPRPAPSNNPNLSTPRVDPSSGPFRCRHRRLLYPMGGVPSVFRTST